MAWDYAHRTHGEGLSWAKVFTGRMKGAASGGTVASAFAIMDAAKESRATRLLLLDPHGLDPVRGKGSRDVFEDDQRGVRFDRDIGGWTAPFVMALDQRAHRSRSHALFKEDGSEGYGARFCYNEAVSFPKGPRGLAMATAVTAGIAGFLAAAAFFATRKRLEARFLS